MSNPFQAFVSTYIGAGAAGVSGNVTFSYCITGQYIAEVPVKIQVSANLSYSAEVRVYRSSDGGNNWESEGNVHLVFPIAPEASGSGAASHAMTRLLALQNGMYLIRVITGSGTAGTFSCELLTAREISAYE